MNIIIFFKFTNLANAPDELFKLLNNDNNQNFKFFFIFNDSKKLKILINKYKNYKIILHFHNKYIDLPFLHSNNIKKIIHYHSEPDKNKVSLNPPSDFYKLVLNQYHCTLPQYSNCHIVRNFFNYNQEIIFNNKIKIGFYPSTIISHNQYYDKGFIETKPIFTHLSKLFPNVIFDLQYNLSYQECINAKKDCHIIIDECKTGSFHKTTLEGIMLGSIVIVNINKNINNIHKKLYKQTLPIIKSDLLSLQDTIISLIKMNKENLEKLAIKNKQIFTNYWNHNTVSQEYFDIYNKLI